MSGAGGPSAPVVEVAVGLLRRADGKFLMTCRPEGKPMAGYWEFPGGKIETGESVAVALAREFAEELDLTITASAPWVVKGYIYPHATVRLHFWRIFAWTGQPRALEGQAIGWESIPHLSLEPWLPGALLLKRWLSLPESYALSNAAELGEAKFLGQLQRVARQGALKFLQLREKSMDVGRFDDLFGEVRAITRDFGITLLVNSEHAVRYWHEADGVHLTSRALNELTVRPDVPWCGASAHARQDLDRAEEVGCDFAALGPVLPTASHPGAHSLGWDRFAELLEYAGLPVYAIGGMTPDLLDVAQARGAHGLAMLRAPWQ